MHDPKAIEAMARAIEAASGAWFEAAPDAVEDCAERALTALCTLHPGVAALLAGEAVAVPRGALLDVRDNARHLNDMAQALAASPWTQEAARDE